MLNTEHPIALQAIEVTKCYRRNSGILRRKTETIAAVNNVSLAVDHGETVALVGESGCGKSTLSRILLGLEEPDSGSVLLGDEDLTRTPAKRLRVMRRHLQVVFQESATTLPPHLTARQIIAEPFRVWPTALAGRNLKEATEGAFTQVGLDYSTLKDRYPHQMSGGQRQRVNIARAFATQPSVLIADEPTSGLDLLVQAQILNLLSDLKDKHKTATVLISHDLSVVRHLADRVAVMKDGQVVEVADTAKLFTSPRETYTRELMEAAEYASHSTLSP